MNIRPGSATLSAGHTVLPPRSTVACKAVSGGSLRYDGLASVHAVQHINSERFSVSTDIVFHPIPNGQRVSDASVSALQASGFAGASVWTRYDGVVVFWSPRHPLSHPLLGGRDMLGPLSWLSTLR